MLAMPSLKLPWMCIAIDTGPSAGAAKAPAVPLGMPSVPRPIRPPVNCSSERRPMDAVRSASADAFGSDEITQCDMVSLAA